MEDLDDAHAISPALLAESMKLSHEQRITLKKIQKQEHRCRFYKDEPVYCPICGAYMRPYTLEEKSEALFCKACGRDMTPVVRQMQQFMKDYVSLMKGEDVERITDEQLTTNGGSGSNISAGESPVCDKSEV